VKFSYLGYFQKINLILTRFFALPVLILSCVLFGCNQDLEKKNIDFKGGRTYEIKDTMRDFNKIGKDTIEIFEDEFSNSKKVSPIIKETISFD